MDVPRVAGTARWLWWFTRLARDYEPTDNEANTDEAPLPQRPKVVEGPPDVPASDESPVIPIRRRLRTKQQDPATEPALKRIHEKLRNENELYKLHLKH